MWRSSVAVTRASQGRRVFSAGQTTTTHSFRENHYSHCDHQRQANGLWMILIYLYYDHFERKRGDGKLISYWTWSQKKTVTGSSLGLGMRWSLSQMLYNCLDWNHDCNTSKVQYQMAYSCWLVFENLVVYGQWMHLDYGHHCIDLVHQAKYITNKISCCMLLQQVYLSNGLSLQVTIPTKTTPPKKMVPMLKKVDRGSYFILRGWY